MGGWKEDVGSFLKDNPAPNSDANSKRKELLAALKAAPDVPELWLKYLGFEENLRDGFPVANQPHTTATVGNSTVGGPTGAVLKRMTIEKLYRTAYEMVENKASEAVWTMGIRLGEIRWEKRIDEGRCHFETLQWKCPHFLLLYQKWALLEYTSGDKSKALKVFKKAVKAGVKLSSELELLKKHMEDGTLATNTEKSISGVSKMETPLQQPAAIDKEGHESMHTECSERIGNENRNPGTSMNFTSSTPHGNSRHCAAAGSVMLKSASKYGPPQRGIPYSSSSSSSGSSSAEASDSQNGQKRKDRDLEESVDGSGLGAHPKRPARCTPQKADSPVHCVPSTVGVTLESTHVSVPNIVLDRRALQDASLRQNLVETDVGCVPGATGPAAGIKIVDTSQSGGNGAMKTKQKGSNLIAQLPTIPEEVGEKSTSPNPRGMSCGQLEGAQGAKEGVAGKENGDKKAFCKDVDQQNDKADPMMSMPAPGNAGCGVQPPDPQLLKPGKKDKVAVQAKDSSKDVAGGVRKTHSSKSGGQSSKDHRMVTGKPKESDEMVAVRGRVYEKLGTLGKGGSSRVFKVRLVDRSRRNMGSTYALKRCEIGSINKEIAQGYKAEVDILRKLVGKPGILQLKDWQIWEEPGIIYMLLEEGETDVQGLLASHVQQRKSFGYSSPDWLFIRSRWAEMLEAEVLYMPQAVRVLHDARIIHSDLKPANFLMVKGHLKLIDFGIARPMANDSTAIFRETLIGTVSYMAPEALQSGNPKCFVVQNSHKVSRPSDIWSLGIILYQMVYGVTPFQSVSGNKKMAAILDEEWEIPFTDADDMDCVDVMRRCLIRDPSKRITMEELMRHPFVNPHHKRESAAVPCEGVMPSPLGKEKLRIALEQVFGKSEELSTKSQALLGVLKKENVGLRDLSLDPNPRRTEEKRTVTVPTGCPHSTTGNDSKPSAEQNCTENDAANKSMAHNGHRQL